MSELPDPGIQGLRQVALAVREVDAATAFYRDAMGLRFLFAAGPDLVFLAAGDVRLMLTRATNEDPPGRSSILYFRVGNVDQAHSAVIARGGTDERGPQRTARMPDHDLWIAFVRDPDGNLVGLLEERGLDDGR